MLRMERGGKAFSYRANRHLTFSDVTRNLDHHATCKFMTVCPGDPGGMLDTSKDSWKTVEDHRTSKHLIAEVMISSNSEDVDEIWQGSQVMRHVWKA